jgi:hypothetical protein
LKIEDIFQELIFVYKFSKFYNIFIPSSIHLKDSHPEKKRLYVALPKRRNELLLQGVEAQKANIVLMKQECCRLGHDVL